MMTLSAKKMAAYEARVATRLSLGQTRWRKRSKSIKVKRNLPLPKRKAKPTETWADQVSKEAILRCGWPTKSSAWYTVEGESLETI